MIARKSTCLPLSLNDCQKINLLTSKFENWSLSVNSHTWNFLRVASAYPTPTTYKQRGSHMMMQGNSLTWCRGYQKDLHVKSKSQPSYVSL